MSKIYMYIILPTKSAKCLSVLLLISFVFQGCQKFLDKKPSPTDAVPTSLADLQALLDNPLAFNSSGPTVAELLADNYFISSSDFSNYLQSAGTRLYVWDENYVESLSWSFPYQGPIYYSNIVLNYLPIVRREPGDQSVYDRINGTALFCRAFAFYELAQLYCKPYSNTANTDDGVVLKLEDNINETVSRVSVQQTYDRIILDLKTAASLLPSKVSVPTRPNKAAAYAALARTYLSMRNYVEADKYAALALEEYDTLIDFNTVAPRMRTFNAEVIYHNYVGNMPVILGSSRARINMTLIQSYDANDLRRRVYFSQNPPPNDTTYRFWGSYHGDISSGARVFDGFTTDELYLIRAECLAKDGKTTDALSYLNGLLQTRWVTGTFTPVTAGNANDALRVIRQERRKELVFRGQRWTDLRRYNLEDSSITLSRKLDDTYYDLPPNNNRWVMLIPWNEVDGVRVKQNPR